MQFNLLTIVGVGLIGGSIGLAAKRRGVARRVRGLGRQQTSLDRALEAGTIDEAHLDPASALAGADVVVFCTPVDQIADQVTRYAAFCPPMALLTDAGSTKATIVERVEKELPASGPWFVGSHPLAGSEKRGPEFADAELFQDRWTVVTPTPRTSAEAVTKITAFWSALGSRVKSMTPMDHDRALAATSHLPHLVAAALAGTLPRDWHELTATGFRDSTRIAAGDPGLWTAIFTHNRGPLLDTLERFERRVREFRQALEQHDAAAIDRLLAQAKEVRDALGN
jgi:prephenate dehydrogenase